MRMIQPRWTQWLLLFCVVLSVVASSSDQGLDHGAGEGGIRGNAATHRQGETPTWREQQVARFLARRNALSPLCLYTFDRAVDRVPPADNNDMPDRFFENHVPDCPFGDLEFDEALVTTLNVEKHSRQLGVRVVDEEASGRKRVQIASTGLTYARDFFTMAVAAGEPEKNNEHAGGVTFEMVLRRTWDQKRQGYNDSENAANRTSDAHMTLFSIANLYDGCVDPGFRVDVDSERMLVLVYYLPVEDIDEQPACYEQLLSSSSEDAFFKRHRTKCQLPAVKANDDDNPPVYIAVTIDPSSNKGMWHTEFLVSYVDPVTLERVQCATSGQKSPPLQTRLLNERVTGNFRLYIGNSPRNSSSQKERRVKAPARKFRPLSSQDTFKNATERLRATLLDKLMSIEGPRIPEAMRIFGDKSFSLKLFGVEFPPVNEDTPLAYLRGKLHDFLVTNGGKIVDHLINMLRKVQPMAEKSEVSIEEQIMQRTIAQLQQQKNAKRSTEYVDAACASSFDLFHFAIYKKALAPKELDDTSWPHLGPFRSLPTTTQELRIHEDEMACVDLVLLHSVYDDVKLELRALPEFGKLLLFPSKDVVTSDNMTSFRELPPEFQKMIYFQPNTDENNDNLPLPYSFAFMRRKEPYSTIKFGMVESRTGRTINTTATASINIFVEPVNDPPRPLYTEQHVVLGDSVVLDLKGIDTDGSPRLSTSNIRPGDKSIGEKTSRLDDLTDRITTELAPVLPPRQFVKISRLPRYGRLYDIHSAVQNESLHLPIEFEGSYLEKYRVSLDDIDNRTFSTDLLYVYGGWNGVLDREKRLGEEVGVVVHDEHQDVVDELRYQLNDDKAGFFSDVAVVKFMLNTSDSHHGRRSESNCLKIVRLQEDSSIAVTLSDIEPLIGFLHPRTKFVITKFPKHGALYQFHDADTQRERDGKGTSTNDSTTYRLGRKLNNASRTVNDVHGRVIYVPERDYYNVIEGEDSKRSIVPRNSEMDSFAFEPENLTESHNLFATRNESGDFDELRTARNVTLPFSALRSREIQIQVVSEPDELVLLPPMYFIANASSGNVIPTPVRFEDPDALYDGKYLATVKANGGFSKFVLGVNISSDDVMKFCNVTRPCLLSRSLDGNHSDEQQVQDAGNKEDGDRTIIFFIQHVIYTPFHITVIGNRKALQHALSEMTFSDWGANFLAAHREQFTVKITRIDDKFKTVDKQSATAIYYVDFPPLLSGSLGEMVGQAVRQVVSQLHEFIWTLVASVLVCALIVNPSCFNGGILCCCCCARSARERRRRAFEEEQAWLQNRVAQNDYEYSMLLMDIADMVLEPDLVFAASLVRAVYNVADCESDEDDSALLRMLCVSTLVQILESERQTTRLVFRLMALEIEEAEQMKQVAPSVLDSDFLGGSSCAGHVLSFFCRDVGKDWLKDLLLNVAAELDAPAENDHGDRRIGNFINRMHRALVDLPVEVVILCRACVKLAVSSKGVHRAETPVALYRAVHLVFFNHFVGPALRFGGDYIPGVSLNRTQGQYLHDIACSLAELTRCWGTHAENPDDYASISMGEDEDPYCRRAQLRKYESLLQSIATSPILQSAYDASVLDTARSPSLPEGFGGNQRVDCDLMAICLVNIHSLLDTFLPQFEAQYDTLDMRRQLQHTASAAFTSGRLPQLRRLLRALSFPSVSIYALLESVRQEIVADRLFSRVGNSASEWAVFVDKQIHGTPRDRNAIQKYLNREEPIAGSRTLGRSESLLSASIEFDIDEISATSSHCF